LEIAHCLVVWGIAATHSDLDGLAASLLAQFTDMSAEAVDEIVNQLFTEELRACAFLTQLLVELERNKCDAAELVLRSILRRFADRFRAPNEDFDFSETHCAPITVVAARAAAIVAGWNGTTAVCEIDSVVSRKRLLQELTPLTPFRLRCGALQADVALGWIAFWGLLASITQTSEDVVTAPREVVEGCNAYLNSPVVGLSEEVRHCIRTCLGPNASDGQPS
jgi:hypothetical protein